MWYVGGNEDVSTGLSNLYAEIEKGADRSIAILAGSIVETHATTFLKNSLQVDEKMWERRAHSSAPLGSFAMKIDLLYMIRLITKEAHSDLIAMKNIRNEFAHNLDVADFATPRIRDKAMALKLVERHVVHSDALAYSSVTHMNGQKSTFAIGSNTALEEIKEPRHRYLWSAKVFSRAFGYSSTWPAPVI